MNQIPFSCDLYTKVWELGPNPVDPLNPKRFVCSQKNCHDFLFISWITI